MAKVAKAPMQMVKMAKPKKYSVSFKAAFAELMAMTLFVYIGCGGFLFLVRSRSDCRMSHIASLLLQPTLFLQVLPSLSAQDTLLSKSHPTISYLRPLPSCGAGSLPSACSQVFLSKLLCSFSVSLVSQLLFSKGAFQLYMTYIVRPI